MNLFRRIIDGSGITWQTSANPDQARVSLVPILLALMTVAAGAIIILAFQRWIDFGITDLSGTEADAATTISDGWFVAGLGSAILILIGAVLFRPRSGPVVLPLIALAALCILGIAGFDAVTGWHASGFHPENPGVLVQAQGDPTIVPYAIAALAILIAFLAAVVRGIQIREGQRFLEDPALELE